MANSVDPDQTSGAVWTRSALYAYVILWKQEIEKRLLQRNKSFKGRNDREHKKEKD